MVLLMRFGDGNRIEKYEKPVKDLQHVGKLAAILISDIGDQLRELPKLDVAKPMTKAQAKEYEKGVAEIEAELIRMCIKAKEHENWVLKQRLPIALAKTAVPSAVVGAINGVLWDVFIKACCSAICFFTPFKGCKLDPEIFTRFGGYRPLVQSIVAGPRMEQARNFAVMRGVGSGISCVMKKYRGKDIDVLTSLVVGFGSGVMLSLVTGMRGPKVMSVGVMFALANGGLFKVEEKLLEQMAEDVLHGKKRDMSSSIGFFFLFLRL